MSRLTTRMSIMGRKHDIEGGQAYHWKEKLKDYDYPLIEEAVDKLGDLEDIEDELGIPLETYFKVIKDGYYTRRHGDSPFHIGAIVEHRIYLGLVQDKEGNWGFFTNYTGTFRLKDYGRTWALTKKELQ